MALSIEPGHDFGVAEVPTRETLLRTARFLRISGLGLDQVDTALVGLKAGTTSGTTSASLPSPGWLWADPGGSLWVETDFGPVKMKRSGGGFESRRWGSSHQPETPVPRPGHPFQADVVNAAAQQTDGISLGAGGSEAIGMWDEVFADSTLGSRLVSHMFAAETNSTNESFPRLVGRGITLVYVNGTQTPWDFCIRNAAGFRVIGSTNAWSGAFISSFSNIVSGFSREHWYGVFLAPHSGTSLVSFPSVINMHDTVYGWKFDQAAYGPGDAS